MLKSSRVRNQQAREVLWIGLSESLLMPVNLPQRLSLYLLLSAPQSCPSSRWRYYLLVNHLNTDLLIATMRVLIIFLRNTENKLVLPQPPTEETFSVQWSSVVEQLTYRTMTSNFIKLLLRRKFWYLFSVFSDVNLFYGFKLIQCVRI